MISTRSRAASGPCLATLAGALAALLVTMTERARQRRRLAALSDWQLKDIGLSRADVAAEVSKPFWRLD